MDFRRALTTFGAVVIAAATSVPMHGQDRGQAPSQGTPQPAQERKKLSKDDLASYEAMNTLVNNVIAGKQPAPSDVKLTFHNHFLKSSQNIYIPYTLDVEPGKLTQGPVAMYVRAVSKNAAAAPAATDKGKTDARGGKSSFAFEDIYILPQVGAQVQRALELPGGEYDLYIAMAERPKDKKAQATAKSVVFTQPLSVPDTGTALTTSSVILAKSIDAEPKQLSPQEQLENPYTISGYKIVPRFTPAIPKSEELVFLFFVYNEGTAASGKPDLDVDYTFARAAEEKPFSKLATTSFNATTLPAEFDISKGHQVFVGQGIPLTSFAPGDYKLEIKINDKTNSSTVTRNVPFTVTP
jgi:hypothetical protein